MTESQDEQEKIMLTVNDLVERWACSKRAVYKWATKGKRGVVLKRLPMPQGYYFSPAAVAAFEKAVTE